jgi:hypothetical protein
MKYTIAVVGVAIAFSVVASDAGLAEPVLMLNEPRDVVSAEYLCGWSENEIKADEYLIKAFKCGESELCQRAIDINSACKVSGPTAEVRAFHSKLLAEFATNPQCAISIIRLTNDKSDTAVKNNLEAFKRANWELNLAFTPGATKQEWAMWPRPSGSFLEGEGDVRQIARDVCAIMTRSGAKILN